MGAPTRSQNQELAAARKKALIERMAARQQAKKTAAEAIEAAMTALRESAAPGVPAPPTPGTANEHPTCSGTAMRLYQDHAETALIPANPLARLVDVYLKAAANKTAHQVLMWPVAPQVLPLVHVLATMEHWNVGHKAGLRGLFFPAKDNTFHPFNHLNMDREDLERHAKSLVQVKSAPDKDPVLFRAVNTTEVLPTLNDLLPHFCRLKKGEHWAPYDDRLLEHTLKKVNRYSQKRALRNNCAVLGAAKTAPDALFAFGYQLDPDDLRESFRSLEKVGRPDVCLVNATRALRFTVPTWQGLLKQFFRTFLAAFPEERPGLVVVTDDPGVSFRVRELIEKEVERTTKYMFS